MAARDDPGAVRPGRVARGRRGHDRGGAPRRQQACPSYAEEPALLPVLPPRQLRADAAGRTLTVRLEYLADPVPDRVTRSLGLAVTLFILLGVPGSGAAVTVLGPNGRPLVRTRTDQNGRDTRTSASATSSPSLPGSTILTARNPGAGEPCRRT